MKNKRNDQIKEEIRQTILINTQKMYDNTGELVPFFVLVRLKGIFDFSYPTLFDLTYNEMIEKKEISIIKNPFHINDDFFGISGLRYPITLQNLHKFRTLSKYFDKDRLREIYCDVI